MQSVISIRDWLLMDCYFFPGLNTRLGHYKPKALKFYQGFHEIATDIKNVHGTNSRLTIRPSVFLWQPILFSRKPPYLGCLSR